MRDRTDGRARVDQHLDPAPRPSRRPRSRPVRDGPGGWADRLVDHRHRDPARRHAKTLRQWQDRLHERRNEVRVLLDDHFCRMGEFYPTPWDGVPWRRPGGLPAAARPSAATGFRERATLPPIALPSGLKAVPAGAMAWAAAGVSTPGQGPRAPRRRPCILPGRGQPTLVQDVEYRRPSGRVRSPGVIRAGDGVPRNRPCRADDSFRW